MQGIFKPIRTPSIKEACISRFEELILSGKLSMGQKLPPERELALQLGVGRPVVHESLVDLASKGLVTLIPRVGTVVNDYRKEGSLNLLTSLINYQKGELTPKLLDDLLKVRMLFETENARLAALNRSQEQLRILYKLLKSEEEIDIHDIEAIVGINFDFHHQIALATENLIYPLLLNSFKKLYTNLLAQYYSHQTENSRVWNLHKELVAAIKNRDEKSAMHTMKLLLDHGEEKMKLMNPE
jgi:DNA-binding FadR family transcriptional regulator